MRHRLGHGPGFDVGEPSARREVRGGDGGAVAIWVGSGKRDGPLISGVPRTDIRDEVGGGRGGLGEGWSVGD